MPLRRPVDRWLLFFAVMLMAIGMVWVYSASWVRGASGGGGAATAFLVRQLVAGLLGLVLMLMLTQVDVASLQENFRPLQIAYGLLMVLLVAVLVIGPKVNGAHRWIRLGPLGSIQPSEIFKPLAVLLASAWMVRHREAWSDKMGSVPKLVQLFMFFIPPMALILLQPDLGTAFLIIFVVMLIVFLGGAPRWIFAVTLPILGLVGFLFIWMTPWRWARIIAFLNPWADPQGKGHQAIQSLLAVGSGGLLGVGPGQGQQKYFYLPEAHTDFIYAVIGEEAGLVGTVTVLALFMGILWRGYRIARRSSDSYLRLVAMGLTLLLVVQALMNMSVVLSLAPNKGIPLPFISFGPNSLITSLICLGLLMSISKDASA
ncbi:MAG TPA: putative lipid II flippase FtsW [Holophagaceae bacterium]|nr:putative lipid II flippase FtsW [Holophagaceae bacterium]